MEKVVSIEQLHTFFITPCPKPRMTRSDRWRKRTAVLRYFEFKNQIRFLAQKEGFIPSDQLYIEYYIEMPASWSKKKKLQMNGQPHKQRPDTDNLTKAIKDALLDEDSTVYKEYAEKYWGEKSKILIGNISQPDKRKALHKHANQRFRERVKIELTPEIREKINEGIDQNKYRMIQAQGSRRMIYRVTDITKQPFNIVYDIISREIVTVLFTH